MGAKQILALYDQDRQEARLFGMQREETPSLVRHISPNGDGLVIYSDLNSTNLEKLGFQRLTQAHSCEWRVK
jgi:hypothetical protein